jgi:tRNA threonylcarbamoyladenosine biosynthesis protein TsaE
MEWQFTLETIHNVALEVLKSMPDDAVVAFHGAMGSGKTSFIHAICDIKKVRDVVGSPTFSIINEYAYEKEGKEKKIFHIDLYRLKDSNEALLAGVEDCFYSGELCFVEWPEKAPGIFPDTTIHIYIDSMDEQTRKLRIGNN